GSGRVRRERPVVARVRALLLPVDPPVAPLLAPAVDDVRSTREAEMRQLEEVPLHAVEPEAQPGPQLEGARGLREVRRAVLPVVEVEVARLQGEARGEQVVVRAGE